MLHFHASKIFSAGLFFIKRGSALSVYIQCLTGADSTHLLLFLIANIDILLRSNSSLKKDYLKYSYSEKAIMVPGYILLEHKVPSCILGGTMSLEWHSLRCCNRTCVLLLICTSQSPVFNLWWQICTLM